MSFASITEAIEDFRAGKMLVVVDDEDRENEGDLTLAAESSTVKVLEKHCRIVFRGKRIAVFVISDPKIITSICRAKSMALG